MPPDANTTTDWITALGTVGAAVGTVAAVIVALWQTRPKRPELNLECIAVTVEKDPIAYLQVRATNRGARPASLQYPPYFVTEQRSDKLHSSIGGPIRNMGTHLPVLLQDGESADFWFDWGDLIGLADEPSRSVLLYASLADQFGTRYYVPAPGVKMAKRWFKKEPQFTHSGVFMRGGPLAKYQQDPPGSDPPGDEPPSDSTGG